MSTSLPQIPRKPGGQQSSVDESGSLVVVAAERFSKCLDTVFSRSERKAHVVKWNEERLRSVLSRVQSLEERLYDLLQPEEDAAEEEIAKGKAPVVRSTDDVITTALRLGTEKLVTATAGSSHSLLLTDNGQVLAFGNGGYGCLGNGGQGTYPSPVSMQLPESVRVLQVAAGHSHSIILADTGRAFASGCNESGQLGLGNRQSYMEPRGMHTDGQRIAQVAAGAHFTLLLNEEGQVLSCGYGSSGQLGHGTRGNELQPRMVSALSSIRSLTAGADHSIVIDQTGVCFAFGNGFFGELGIGETCDLLEPRRIPGLENLVASEAAAGTAHTLVLGLDRSGCSQVFSFGCGKDGQLGLGDYRNRLRPEHIGALSEFAVAQVSAGNYHSLVRTETGSILVFGSGAHGKLGLGDTGMQNKPQFLGGLEIDVSWVACGGDHSIALESNGRLYTWGSSRTGQLGLGDYEPCRAPMEMVVVRPQTYAGKASKKAAKQKEQSLKEKVMSEKLEAAKDREVQLRSDLESLRTTIMTMEREATNFQTNITSLENSVSDLQGKNSNLHQEVEAGTATLRREHDKYIRSQENGESFNMGNEDLLIQALTVIQSLEGELQGYRALEAEAGQRSMTLRELIRDYDVFRQKADSTQRRLEDEIAEGQGRETQLAKEIRKLQRNKEILERQHDLHEQKHRAVLEHFGKQLSGSESQQLKQRIEFLEEQSRTQKKVLSMKDYQIDQIQKTREDLEEKLMAAVSPSAHPSESPRHDEPEV